MPRPKRTPTPGPSPSSLGGSFTAASLRALSPEGRARLIAALSPEERETLKYLWEFWARPDQLTPAGNWLIWLLLAGRGFGKTRTLCEKVRERVERGGCKRIALVGSTSDDVRAVLIEGESGILAISPPNFRPKYQPALRRLTWPNGAIATTYSADEPDRFRGPQHDFAACDEVAAWKYPESFDMLMFGLRLGANPQCVIATTPRPIPIIKELVKRVDTVVTRGSTMANAANLAPIFLNQVLTKYQGTRLGRQEIDADLLEDTPGALWNEGILERSRRMPLGRDYRGMPVFADGAQMVRIVVAVDPAGKIQDMVKVAEGKPIVGGNSSTGDEAGIVVAGKGDDDDAYILEDASTSGSPHEWGKAAVEAYLKWNADAIVVEYNHGGETVEEVIQAVAASMGLPPIKVIQVWASRGKYTRAEPISSLYEQDRCHHAGLFDKLEDEQCTFVPGAKSPNRLDAAVFAVTELMVGAGNPGKAIVGDQRKPYELMGIIQ